MKQYLGRHLCLQVKWKPLNGARARATLLPMRLLRERNGRTEISGLCGSSSQGPQQGGSGVKPNSHLMKTTPAFAENHHMDGWHQQPVEFVWSRQIPSCHGHSSFFPTLFSPLPLRRRAWPRGGRGDTEIRFSRTREPDHATLHPSKVLECEGLGFKQHTPFASCVPCCGAGAEKQE